MSSDFLDFFAPKICFLDSITFLQKKFWDLTLSNIPPANTTSSSSTTSTTSTFSIPSTDRRSTGLHPHIYSRLSLFQIRTAASGTEAESICLFRTSLSFRVQRNIVPLADSMLVLRFGSDGGDPAPDAGVAGQVQSFRFTSASVSPNNT